ncbi:MAG: lipopolysaccharide transport periplasmic protein LptA [Alphaproteobacteria bacterium]|nr:MAG: lipopolysaccharide transport periplasmic protein LptA [Alphaproteobacteria bacterium]
MTQKGLRVRRFIFLFLFVLSLAAQGSTPALAQGDGSLPAQDDAAGGDGGDGGAALQLGKQEPGLPIEITSEKLRLDREANTALFETKVVARQGGLTLKSDRLLVEYATDETGGYTEVRKLTATGNVVLIQARPEQPDAKPDIAQGDMAVYDLASETIVMTGNVLVAQNDTVVTGDKLTYHVDTGRGLMEGNVTTLLTPQQSQ